MNHFSPSRSLFQDNPENPPSAIEVIHISPVQNRGALRAFVSLRIYDLIIHDCRIVQEPSKQAWVSMPSFNYKTQHGTVNYRTLVIVENPRLKREISQVVLHAWEEYEGGNDGNTIQE